MGIKGFSVFLNHINCEWETTSLTTFAGSIMAVDGIMYLYQTKLSSRHPVRLFIEFLTKLKAADIKPVFVMDGKYVREKEQEQAYRVHKRQHLQEVVDKLSTQLNQYKLKKEIGRDLAKLVQSNASLFLHKLSKTLNTHALSAHISKLSREVKPIPRHVKDLFLLVCQAFGVPVVWAQNDGEMLCAALNRVGKVDVVFSHDSDAFAAGAVCVIKQIDGVHVKTLTLAHILETSKLSFQAFRDMCILCGTDYNKRIPGLGPVTAYNLIKTHHTIEAAATGTDYNLSSFDPTRVREIYSVEDTSGEIVFAAPNKARIKALLTTSQLGAMYPTVEKVWGL